MSILNKILFKSLLVCSVLSIQACSYGEISNIKEATQDLEYLCSFIRTNYKFLDEKIKVNKTDFFTKCGILSGSGSLLASFVDKMKEIRSLITDGHVYWRLPDNLSIGDDKHLPVLFKVGDDGDVYVSSIDGNYSSLSVGDRVVKISNIPAIQYINKVALCSPQSTMRGTIALAARMSSMYLSNRPCQETVNSTSITSSNSRGVISEIEVPWITGKGRVNPMDMPIGNENNGKLVSREEDNGLLLYNISLSNENIFLLKVKGFLRDHWGISELENAISLFNTSGSPHLVIDLRDASGGSTDQVYTLLDAINVPFIPTLFVRSFDEKVGFFVKWYDIDYRKVAVRVDEGKRITLLSSATCGSACEYFVAHFKHAKRGIVIGDYTAGRMIGYTHGGETVTLPNSKVMWTFGNEEWLFDANMDHIEGIGVAPDIPCSLGTIECLSINANSSP